MSDEVIPGGEGAEKGAEGVGGEQRGALGEQAGDKGEQAQFAVPEAYKGKSWAGKVKSLDDVYKQIDSLDSLAGKKTVVPDFENGKKEDIDAYLATLRGKTTVKDYKFPEGTNTDIAGKVSQVFFERGIPAAIGNQIISAYAEIGKAESEKAFSKDGMLEELVNSFGGEGKDRAKAEQVGGETATFLKANLSPEDQKLVEMVPNNLLGLLYRFANKVKTEYGVNETGAAGRGDRHSAPGTDKKKVQSEIRAKIREIDKRPHEASEKAALIQQLTDSYK